MCVSSDKVHSLSMEMHPYGWGSFSHSHIDTFSALGSSSVDAQHVQPWRQHLQGPNGAWRGTVREKRLFFWNELFMNKRITTYALSCSRIRATSHVHTDTDPDAEHKAELKMMIGLHSSIHQLEKQESIWMIISPCVTDGHIKITFHINKYTYICYFILVIGMNIFHNQISII